jgi:histone-arginine methyltransferase CARM1
MDAHEWKSQVSLLYPLIILRFWEQKDFYGVDFSPLADDARVETFAQPIVGCFDPRMTLASPISHTIDFMSISIEELKKFSIPIEWKSGYTGIAS